MVRPSFTRGGQGTTGTQGFTLLEILVSIVLFMLVMLLLARGVTAVTTTVTLGQRQSQLHRILKSVRRVMQEDVEAMIVHPDWPVFVGDATAPAPQLMLGFMRYRPGSEGETETEWVQYWREEHDVAALQPRLEKWVRYSAPCVNRDVTKGEWWLSVDRSQLSGEVLVDDLIALDLGVETADRNVTGIVTNQVDVVDVRIYLTVPPLPPVDPISSTSLKRMEEEEGTWMHFLSRPGFVAGPIVDEVVAGTP